MFINHWTFFLLTESARGKKDKGGGMLLVMAMMMGKMMMTMGFGGIGLLTMKALMVSVSPNFQLYKSCFLA